MRKVDRIIFGEDSTSYHGTGVGDTKEKHNKITSTMVLVLKYP